jgi:hypothetical protein
MFYKHNCDGCIYIGSESFDGRDTKDWDYYYCPNCDNGSVVARYGNEGGDYTSTSIGLMGTMALIALENTPSSHLSKAYLMGVQKGIIPDFLSAAKAREKQETRERLEKDIMILLKSLPDDRVWVAVKQAFKAGWNESQGHLASLVGMSKAHFIKEIELKFWEN